MQPRAPLPRTENCALKRGLPRLFSAAAWITLAALCWACANSAAWLALNISEAKAVEFVFLPSPGPGSLSCRLVSSHHEGTSRWTRRARLFRRAGRCAVPFRGRLAGDGAQGERGCPQQRHLATGALRRTRALLCQLTACKACTSVLARAMMITVCVPVCGKLAHVARRNPPRFPGAALLYLTRLAAAPVARRPSWRAGPVEEQASFCHARSLGKPGLQPGLPIHRRAVAPCASSSHGVTRMRVELAFRHGPFSNWLWQPPLILRHLLHPRPLRVGVCV